MKKSTKRLAVVLAALMTIQPAMFAVVGALT